jgi:hypothetical protein
MRTKPFSELRQRMTPEQRAESETRAKLILLHLTLIELQPLLVLGQDCREGDVESIIPDVEN